MKHKTQWILIGCTLLLGWLMISCEGPDQPVYDSGNPDPNPTGVPAATIVSISPDTAYLRDIITINGSGFDIVPENNFVTFGSKQAKVIEAQSDFLKVRAPNLSDETVDLKLAVKGTEFWSNDSPFTFKLAVILIDEEISWPNGVAIDEDENVYVGSANDGIIYKITPDFEKSEFVEVAVNGAIDFGPDGYLYVCMKGENKIVRISPDGGTVEDVVEVDAPIDFDWDSEKNMYIVSGDYGIKKYDLTQSLTDVASIGSAKCVRIYDNHLYVSNIWDGQILRYEITAAGLENEEIFLEGDSPLGIEFDNEGTLYYTLAWETSLFTLSQDGTEETLFDGQLQTPMHYINTYNKWMYIVYPGWGDVGVVLKTYIGVEQAPNYGRE